MADALVTLSSMWDRPIRIAMKPLVIMKIRAPCYGGESVMSTHIGPEEKPWFYDIKKFHRRKKVSRWSNFEREICSSCSCTQLCKSWWDIIQKNAEWNTVEMSQEGWSKWSDERDSYRSLWSSYEWYNLSQEDSMTRVLLDEYGKGLYPNSEVVSSTSSTWEFQSSPAYYFKQLVISMAFCSMRDRYNRRNKAECVKWA